MTSGPQNGFEAVTVSESSVNDQIVIKDLTVTLTLSEDSGADTSTRLAFE